MSISLKGSLRVSRSRVWGSGVLLRVEPSANLGGLQNVVCSAVVLRGMGGKPQNLQQVVNNIIRVFVLSWILQVCTEWMPLSCVMLCCHALVAVAALLQHHLTATLGGDDDGVRCD